MAVDYPAQCNSCKHEFRIYTGHGFYFTICSCVDCGKSKRIDHPNERGYAVKLTPEIMGKCEECGGNISEDAPKRCPKCKSIDITIDDSSVLCID